MFTVYSEVRMVALPRKRALGLSDFRSWISPS